MNPGGANVTRWIHPGRLTWNIIIGVWKIIFLSKWVICRFHVNLPGCMPCQAASAPLHGASNFHHHHCQFMVVHNSFRRPEILQGWHWAGMVPLDFYEPGSSAKTWPFWDGDPWPFSKVNRDFQRLGIKRSRRKNHLLIFPHHKEIDYIIWIATCIHSGMKGATDNI